jgi:foldase protein PrsA
LTDKKEKKSYEEMKEQMEKELKSSKLTTEKINEIMQKEIKDAKVKISDKDLENALDPQTAPAQQ